MSFDLQTCKRQIQAFYPIYLPNVGNATRVDTVDGESYVIQVSLRAFLNRLSSCFGIDRPALQHKYGQLTGQKNGVSLPLGFRYVFIPLQLREPRLTGDGSIGYVQLHRIKEILDCSDDPFKSSICFTDNRRLQCLNTRETIQKHLHDAQYIYEIYLQEFCGSTQYREILGMASLLQRMIPKQP